MSLAAGYGADSAYEHLRGEMDRYHKTFDVYTDVDAGGNHYVASEWMQGEAVRLDPFWTSNVHSGVTCIRCRYLADSADWAGVGWVDAFGYDLTGADTCWFWAKGDGGSEVVEFGVGGDQGDSIHKYVTLALGDTWARYAIDLSGGVLRHLHRGFYWVASRYNNPTGCVFFLDDIQFDLDQTDSLRFIQTYFPLLYLHDREWALNQAYTYPNVLAMLAFMARGTADDMARAENLGDAFALCQGHDRHFGDGRLRNAYMTGNILDRTTGKARLPGWWDPDSGRWFEDRYQVGTYAGEMAWLLTAWLTYDSVTGTTRYDSNAVRLANWIQDNCWCAYAAGYRGGFEGPDDTNPRLPWFSTEHNLDLYVAFTRLYCETGDTLWRARANAALAFVQRMWNPARGYFRCGMKDSVTIDSVCVLDAQAWGLLATRDTAYLAAIDAAESRCKRTVLSHDGFCFSEAGDGIWWEGTAQMCCAYLLAKQESKYDTFAADLHWCQDSGPHNNRKGIVSCLPESSYTGMNRFWGRWQYYARLDVGATAWFTFSEERWNPYWHESLSPVGVREDTRCGDVGSGRSIPTIIRGVLKLGVGLRPKPILLDIAGRKVFDLKPGANDVGRLAPGVYFIQGQKGSATTKVVIQR